MPIAPTRWFAALLAMLLFALPAAARSDDAALALALQRTEDIRAVRDLQIRFAQRIEAGEWTAAAALFADDGSADWSGVEAHGPDKIGSALRQRLGAGREGRPAGSLHTVLEFAPVLTLAPDGQSALGRWHEVGLFGGAGVTVNWTGGIYENRYVKTDTGWRIALLAYHPLFSGDYADGWFNSAPDLLSVRYHYAVETVGAPVTRTASAQAHGPGIGPADIAVRAQRLADEDAVRNLQHAFGFYADRRMWDDAVDLFAPGAFYASSDAGTFVGPDGIRAMLEREGPAGLRYGDLDDHVLANLLVCVAPDGTSARARGIEFGMSGNNDRQAFWSLTLFDNLFVKSGGVWRFAAVRRFPRMRTRHDVSWEHGLEPLPQPDRQPDREAAAEPGALDGCAPANPGTTKLEPALAGRQIEAAAAAVAIDNVSNALGNYIDDFEWKSLGLTFTRDGMREAPGIGFYRGPERIYRMQSRRYGGRPSPRTFIPIHMRTQPVVHVSPDGEQAKVRTRLLQFNSTARGSDRAGSMGAAIYEDEARLEDGVWRFASVEIDHYLQTRSYREAWTGVPRGFGAPAAGQADEVRRNDPPDAPLVGEIFAPYPAIGLMWFHYANPVSGRRPDHMTPKTIAVASGR